MDFPWVEEEEGGRVRDLLQLMVFAARPPRQRPRSRYLAVPQFAEKIVISNQPYNWFSTTAPLLPSGAVTFREPGRPHRAQLRAFDEVATDDNDVTHFTLLVVTPRKPCHRRHACRWRAPNSRPLAFLLTATGRGDANVLSCKAP